MNRRMTMLFGGAVAIVLFGLMALTIMGTEPWQEKGNAANVAAANEQATVVEALFGPQVIAFEVLGILLTAAMIGALVIARPLDAQADETHYGHPTVQQVAESDRASDVASHALPAPSTTEVAP